MRTRASSRPPHAGRDCRVLGAPEIRTRLLEAFLEDLHAVTCSIDCRVGAPHRVLASALGHHQFTFLRRSLGGPSSGGRSLRALSHDAPPLRAGGSP